jgi:Dehydroquinase class II
MTKILLVQGANLTFLGRREPAIYGTTTAAELDAMLQSHARKHDYVLDIFYSNIEGEAINRIYRAVDEGFDGLVMNPAGFTYAGWPRGTFWRAYCRNQEEAVDEVVDTDPVAAMVRAFMKTQQEWAGTASQLLSVLAELAEGQERKDAWPDSPRALSGQTATRGNIFAENRDRNRVCKERLADDQHYQIRRRGQCRKTATVLIEPLNVKGATMRTVWTVNSYVIWLGLAAPCPYASQLMCA